MSTAFIKNANGPVNEQNPLTFKSIGARSVGFENLTITGTVTGLTASKYGNARIATIIVETADIRYKLNGDSPTATEGLLAEVGDIIVLESQEDIQSFKAIRTGSTSAVLNIDYSL